MIGLAGIRLGRPIGLIVVARLGWRLFGGRGTRLLILAMGAELFAGVVQFLQFFMCLLPQAFVVLRNAIRVPNEHQIPISLVYLFEGGTRL